MVRFASAISRLNKCKILVAGDLMLDTYTIGKAKRISPEAPVAVVLATKEENRPGGAGNVGLNLISLGCEVRLLGRLGSDAAAAITKEALEQEKIDLTGVFTQPTYKTPVKNRIIADNQQIVRVDHEEITPLPEVLEQHIIDCLPTLVEGVDAVAVSDYGKGFLTKTLLSALIQLANKKKIPVITDPKGVDFAKYSGSTIIKPNLSEAYAAANLLPDTPLDVAAKKILNACQAEMLMVTRSEAGISVFNANGSRLDFPVKAREIKDVTGAGDTVLSMLTCAIANGIDISEAAPLSNVAAGIAIERFGCARISLNDLAERLLEQHVTNKVFNDEHLYALQKVLGGSCYTLLALSGDKGLSTDSFKAIKQLSGNANGKLVIYIKDELCDSNFIDLLSSIHAVNYIIQHEETLKSLCECVNPKAVYSVSGKAVETLASYQELLQSNALTR